MAANKRHLAKALELLKEEVKLARYELEDSHETTKEAQRREAETRDKYLALKAAVLLLEGQLEDDDPNIA
ncbi:MAG: hypothetical protein ACOYBT_10290 [Polynucleobacter sp.]